MILVESSLNKILKILKILISFRISTQLYDISIMGAKRIQTTMMEVKIIKSRKVDN
jgi:hypothetical protein